MSEPKHPEPQIDSEVGYEEYVPEDDSIIGQALRWSLLIFVAIGLLAAVAWFFLRPSTEVVVVEEAPVIAPQRTVVETPPPSVQFTDIARAAGIDFRHVSGATGERLLPETMGGGVAFLDYDNDQDPDLLFINSGNLVDEGPSAPIASLYRNAGDGTFENVTADSGLDTVSGSYGMGIAVADVDGDGFRDMFVTAVGHNRLLKNMGNGRFEDVTEAAGVAGEADAWSSCAAFFDADNDGDLDLFVCNYVEWSPEIDHSVDYRMTGIGRAYGPPTNYAGTYSYLYRNRGDGTFEDVSEAAGIRVANPATGLPAGKSLAVMPMDLDDNGLIDLMVANDTVQNFVFLNQGDGRFEEAGMVTGLAFDNTGSATGAMGIDAARYGNDELAIAVGNFANEMTSFYVGRYGHPQFTDQSIGSGIGPDSRQALSFGVFFFDYDLDGRLDFLQTNGHVEDEINVVQPSQHYEQPTQLFWNCGSDCDRQYTPVELEDTGDLGTPVVGRGAAYADIDGDGDLDVAVTQINRRPLLLRNEQQLGNHWLRVRLVGPALNADGLGARIEIGSGDQLQSRIVTPTRSYLSQMELPVTFGLGSASEVDQLTVYWPDGSVSERRQIAADQELVISSDDTPD